MPPVLYLVAITALVIGLARPSMVMAVPRDEATIILTIDVSGSMQATDVQPTRLAAAQKAASDFVDQLPSAFRVGLVVFSTEARIELPPTTDHAQVHTAIDNLAAHGGTALGDAIELSLEAAGVAGSGSGTGQARRRRRTRRPARRRARRLRPTRPLRPTRRPRRRRRRSRSSPPSSCPTAPTRPDRSTRSRRPTTRPPPACRSTRSPSARPTARSSVQDPFGQTAAAPGPARHRRPWRRSPRRPAASSSAPRPAEDLAQIYESLGSKVGYTQQEQEVTQLFAGGALLFVLAGAGLAALWFNRFP